MRPLVFIGYDSRQQLAYEVAARSLLINASRAAEVRPVMQADLRARGLYTRPQTIKEGRVWDEISGAPMSTEFALTRFLVPYLTGFNGWALFCDSDFLFFGDVRRLAEYCDTEKALLVVKHEHKPANLVKMDNQIQTSYPCKNWSSFILWNCGHEANRRLDPAYINTARGLDLHQFKWLSHDLIGDLPVGWNYLVGHTPPGQGIPKAAHFTDGTPDMPGCNHCEFAESWQAIAKVGNAAYV